jgi:hypothetical protein
VSAAKLTPVSSRALKADLMARGFSEAAAVQVMTAAQDAGEWRGITFRIVADDNEQQYYVENFPW